MAGRSRLDILRQMLTLAGDEVQMYTDALSASSARSRQIALEMNQLATRREQLVERAIEAAGEFSTAQADAESKHGRLQQDVSWGMLWGATLSAGQHEAAFGPPSNDLYADAEAKAARVERLEADIAQHDRENRWGDLLSLLTASDELCDRNRAALESARRKETGIRGQYEAELQRHQQAGGAP